MCPDCRHLAVREKNIGKQSEWRHTAVMMGASINCPQGILEPVIILTGSHKYIPSSPKAVTPTVPVQL